MDHDAEMMALSTDHAELLRKFVPPTLTLLSASGILLHCLFLELLALDAAALTLHPSPFLNRKIRYVYAAPQHKISATQMGDFYTQHPESVTHVKKKGLRQFCEQHDDKLAWVRGHGGCGGVIALQANRIAKTRQNVAPKVNPFASDNSYIVDSASALEFARSQIVAVQVKFLAFDLVGEVGEVGELKGSLHIKNADRNFAFHLAKLAVVCRPQLQAVLNEVLSGDSSAVSRVAHDVHRVSAILWEHLQIKPTSVVDTQLLCETLQGKPFARLEDVLELLHKSNDTLSPINKSSGISELLHSISGLLDLLSKDQVKILFAASQARVESAAVSKGKRAMICNRQKGYALASLELVQCEQPSVPGVDVTPGLKVSQELEVLFELLPSHYLKRLGPEVPLFKLRDIVLDVGAPPRAFFGSEIKFLCEDVSIDKEEPPASLNTKSIFSGMFTALTISKSKQPHTHVKPEELKKICDKLQHRFGPSNRAGLDGCLHRISAMRNLSGDIYGLTFRIGRSVTGNADMMKDILLGSAKSVLVLGVPGTGKTTIVRECCRLLASSGHNVCVVDTTNEICGDGDVPHPSVGISRRMMVPSLAQQGNVMIECLQNHTPDVIVIDEIGRAAEVEASKTVKQRGVRLVGSAHGDLRTLVKNAQLRGALEMGGGGVGGHEEQVVLPSPKPKLGTFVSQDIFFRLQCFL
jgi:stage III sporulation protein SpoIIIAA